MADHAQPDFLTLMMSLGCRNVSPCHRYPYSGLQLARPTILFKLHCTQVSFIPCNATEA